MRLLLDEHLSPRIADTLTAQGIDAVSVSRRPDLIGRDDLTLLRAATAEDRAIVTRDLGDFIALAAEAVREGVSHGGVVLVPGVSYGEAGVGRIARALVALRTSGATRDIRNTVTWLDLGA